MSGPTIESGNKANRVVARIKGRAIDSKHILKEIEDVLFVRFDHRKRLSWTVTGRNRCLDPPIGLQGHP